MYEFIKIIKNDDHKIRFEDIGIGEVFISQGVPYLRVKDFGVMNAVNIKEFYLECISSDEEVQRPKEYSPMTITI